MGRCGTKPAQKGTPLLGCSDPVEAPQELRKIVAGGGDLMALVQVFQPAQRRPAHPAGVEQVGKAALDVLAALAQ